MMINQIHKKAYKFKKTIITYFSLQKKQGNLSDFVYEGSKVYHFNKKDHVAVIRTTLINGSHKFKFCKQALDLEDHYQNIEHEFIIVDLGAHIGCTSLFYAKNFPKSKIIAVEPFQENYRLLKENLAFHENAKIFQNVVGDRNNASVKFYDNLNDSWAYGLIKTTRNSVEIDEVKMITLTDLLKDYQNTDNFILKIDIEGSEKLIFDNEINWKLIDTFKIVIVEIHDWMFPGQNTANGLLKWAVESNRDVCINGENLWFFKNR
jgi:FkbM family methyltransferase